MIKRIISLILVISTLFMFFAVNASAASGEEFISEVALVYEDTVEKAKAAIAGTDWKLFEQDLNPKADYMFDDGVYLVYKTSTNVEDAITDLRVMDMYGGYSTSNYEKQLEASREGYMKIVSYIRTAASEFKTLYEAGDEMAKLAYRQMNYYKDIGGTNLSMGDFMLNIPSDDALVTVLFEGNGLIVTNLIRLLVVGISGNNRGALATRIAEMYEVKDTLTDVDYYDTASALNDELKEISSRAKRYDALAEKYDLTDETMTEEEFTFMSEYASIAMALDQIPYGNGTLKTFLSELVWNNWSHRAFYPVVAALSEGQRALVNLGMFTTILQYGSSSKPIDQLNATLEENEKKITDDDGNIKQIDVYIGVDRSIFKGNFAMTNVAERQQALTGKTWDMDSAEEASDDFYTASIALAICDFVAWCACSLTAMSLPSDVGITALTYTVTEVYKEFMTDGSVTIFTSTTPHVSATGILFWSAVGIGVAMAGLAGISTWYNYYNPDYTVIPDTMIDVRETELGDKYVKFTAAKVFGDKDGRNADLNAYEGKEWNALYYTKDATAGKCLTPNFVYSDNNSTIARRHQGISMFGETKAFNLNSHVYSKNAPSVYVTMRYSTAKKAAADLPDVVGSIFGGAFYALAALGGIGVGVCATVLAQKVKKKK